MSSTLKEAACPYCGHQGLEITFSPVCFYCSDCNRSGDQETLINSIVGVKTINYQPDYLGNFGHNPSLIHNFGLQTELSNEERKSFYFKMLFITFVVYSVFFACLSSFFPLNNFSWLLLIGIFIASRIADMVSTVFALSLGATETNPMSDPHDISKLILPQIIQACIVVGASFLLGLISIWLKIGFLFVFSLMGFHAFFANTGQVLSGPASSTSDVSGKFYTAHVISIILVIAIVSILAGIYF